MPWPSASGPHFGVWKARRARAKSLSGYAPETDEILATYADLTRVQEDTARQVPTGRWLALVDAAESGPPRMRLDRLLVDELVPLFADFLADASALGTDVMQAHAGDLSAAMSSGQGAVFAAALSPTLDDASPFHVRAFLQAVATTLATSGGDADDGGRGRRCFACGGAPVVGILEDQDEPDADDELGLVCGICGSSWSHPRQSCAHCGEDDPERLATRKSSVVPWVQLDECTSCGRYLKTVDLREQPDAVPVVDELAGVELDEWARGHGLQKVQLNLFGY